MNFKSFLLSAVCVCALVSTAHAEESPSMPKGLYFGVKTGAAFMDIDNIKNKTDVANPAVISKKSEDDSVWNISPAIGYDWSKTKGVPVRTELEYTWRADMNYDSNPIFVNAAVPSEMSSKVESESLMLNVYYDIKIGEAFTPYVGVGLGYARNKTETKGYVPSLALSDSGSKTKTNFAWSLGAGSSYTITDNLSFDAGYRYVDLGKAMWEVSDVKLASDDIDAHEIRVGLRYTF